MQNLGGYERRGITTDLSGPALDLAGPAAYSGPLEGFVMPDFKREDRFLVLKRTDIDAALTDLERHFLMHIAGKVNLTRRFHGKIPLHCVVVESDWPEYEPTWKAIEVRTLSGGIVSGDGECSELDRLRGLIYRATAELETVEYDNDPPARVVALLGELRAVSKADQTPGHGTAEEWDKVALCWRKKEEHGKCPAIAPVAAIA